ncbi:lytic murein transglycosylase [Methyloligella sp. 2.7D]|uniref:lytic murein transglycosylase n=1 Tax=unclassified Methyloligella TaxID=2625955 RepID=UPI00157C7743|nr:lytic murein transglycosylase [Methyloligella sp. GL2]QKP78713.1 lytic murein transglycosylase [Methyloligella sp. GL2]
MRPVQKNLRRAALALALPLLVLGAVAGYAPRAEAASFQAWVESFWPTARAAGIRRDVYERAFRGLTPDPEVIEAANYQPEYKRPVGEYIDRAVSDKRLETGQRVLVEYKPLLDAVENRYGVDRHIVVAIWAIESNYGENPGDDNVIRSLATLAYRNTKAKFARQQLIAALKILQRGDIDLAHMNGSWAGAMGHTQFIPTTYEAYAVDFDGDGRRNIWGSLPDALGSTAHYLKVSGWRPGETWGYEVQVPRGFNTKAYGLKSYKTLAQWQRMGVRRVSGAPFPRPNDKAGMFAPEGTNGPIFLVINNFRSILRYNQAPSYALAVGHLADRLMGYGEFAHPWPTDENHLSLDQRKELQARLLNGGFLDGDVDGVIGPATLSAVKAYQRQKGLAVDGYPTLTLLKMLRADST